MNAKTAKKLRKIATGMVVMAEQNGQKIDKVSYVKDAKGTISVSKRSWKGVYKSLKNGFRQDPSGYALENLKTIKNKTEQE